MSVDVILFWCVFVVDSVYFVRARCRYLVIGRFGFCVNFVLYRLSVIFFVMLLLMFHSGAIILLIFLCSSVEVNPL